VVLHLGTRRYYTVSETGLDILEALAAPKTLEELAAALMAKYEVTAEGASASTEEFLREAVRSGMVTVEEDP
jgi:hypothetical protein